jgi:ADP-ribosylglycohydrolase
MPAYTFEALDAQGATQKGVLEAVNDGGDTDSTASMTGALIAANGAMIPEWMKEWPNQTEEDSPAAIDLLSQGFFAVAMGERIPEPTEL